jgi:hypothetical protein
MFTGVILMCTADMWCYTVMYENGFFQSRADCEAAIEEVIKSEDFDATYRFYEEGRTYNVQNTTCINWDEKNI